MFAQGRVCMTTQGWHRVNGLTITQPFLNIIWVL